MLCDEALETLAAVYEACETAGVWPTQLWVVLMQLIGKPKGGFRNIAVLPGPVRLWERLRRTECEEWVRTMDRPYWAFGTGRSAEMAVWRRAVLAEASVADSGAAAGTITDMRKFFERINLTKLAHAWVKLGFPAPIAKLCINLWRGPRAVRLRQLLCPYRLRATCGIPAGSVFADLAVMAYCVSPLDALVKAWPRAALDVYMDDIHVAATGSAEAVRSTVVGAMKDLKRVVLVDYECSFADEKAATVASTRALAKAVAQDLGAVAGQPSTAAEYLGVDFAPGANRGSTGAANTRNKRWKRAATRLRRVLALRRRVTRAKGRMQCILRNGVRPMVGYGSQVNGVDDAEWLRLRRLLLAASAPLAKGTSLTAKTVIQGDPAWREATAP